MMDKKHNVSYISFEFVLKLNKKIYASTLNLVNDVFGGVNNIFI